MDFLYYVASSYPLIWVDTIEYERTIQDLCSKSSVTLKSKCFIWDIVQGIKDVSNNRYISCEEITPMQPIEFICTLKERHNIIFCKDYHLFLEKPAQSVELWRYLLNNIDKMKEQNNIFVIVSPYSSMCSEISRYFTYVNFPLPTKEELRNVLIGFINKKDFTENKISEIINNGIGLTEFEFENALAFSIAKYGEVNPMIIYEQKKQLIKQSTLLEICNHQYGFDSIAGLNILKGFTKRMISSSKGRGVFLLGVPGTGKSYFAKCLGKETGRLTISLNFGQLMGSLVGETERKTRATLQLIDNMAPCILYIDELEKGLSGMNNSNSDGGVSVRQGGQFLTWLNDHESDVFVVATANDATKLPSELLRAERWDCIFFIDIPTLAESSKLLELYAKEYNLTVDYDIDVRNYTGAEIKTLCRLASCLNISIEKAKKYVTPIYKINKEKIDELRKWSKNRTINASSEVKENYEGEWDFEPYSYNKCEI